MAMTKLASFGIAIAIAAGCGSSHNSTVDGKIDSAIDAPGITASQACADVVHALCEKRDTCSNDFDNDHTYGSEALCESRTMGPCVTDLGAAGTGASPESRELCALDYAMQDSTCLALYDNDPTSECTPPAGSGATGSACGVPAQCASTYCAIAQNDVCGTCQPLPTAGATCTVDADCGRNMACAIAVGASTGACSPYVALAGSCLTGVNVCEGGTQCVGEVVATSTAGTCQTSGATVSAPCDSSRKTEAACANELGLACIPSGSDTTIGTCQPIALAAASSPCGSLGTPVTSFAECIAGGLCVKATSTAKAGTCVAPAADGAACDSVMGPPCLAPAKCVPTTTGGTAGTCTVPDATQCH